MNTEEILKVNEKENPDETIVYEAITLEKDTNLSEMSDSDILYDHAVLHYRFNRVINGANYKDWNKEDFVNYHVLMVEELQTRKMSHFPYNDELDKLSKPLEKKYEVTKSDGKVSERIFLDEVLSHFDSFKMRHPYISLVGGLVAQGNTENDIDILIKDSSDISLFYKHILEWRILRSLPPKFWDRIKFHYDQSYGDFTDYIALYDMTIERTNKENKIIEMSFSGGDSLKQNINFEVKREAELSIKEDSIKLFRYFIPVKSILSSFMAYKKADMFLIDNIIKYLKDVAEKNRLKTKIPTIIVQKMCGGIRYEIHKDGDKVIILSEEGKDNTDMFPDIVQEILRLKGDNFVLDTKIEMWKDGKRESKENLYQKISKGEMDDIDSMCNVLDILFYNNVDLHNVEQIKRYDEIEKLGIKQSTNGIPNTKTKLNFLPIDITSSIKTIKQIIKDYSELPELKGVIIKLANSKYPLDGVSTDIIKYKSAASIAAVIWKVNETKVEGIFSYDVALAVSVGQKVDKDSLVDVGGKRYSKIGKTFNTDLKVGIGDIIKVGFQTIDYYYDPEEGNYTLHLYEPIVSEICSSWGRPDFLEDAIRIGKESNLLVEKAINDFDSNNYIDDVERHFEKAVDPFMIIPPEEERYKYVVQQHWRGKSVHADLRIESINQDTLIGWTLNTQIKDTITEPIETVESAKKFVSGKYSKIDWNNGQWARRSSPNSDKEINAELSSQRKAIEPIEWLTIEGVIPKGEVGATKDNVGVLHIVDKGECQYLAQKPYFHEYYFQTDRGKGGLKGRYLFRQLETESIGKDMIESVENVIGEKILDIEKITLPASETEYRQESAWFFIKPEDQTPYVLSNRAINQKWIPPKDVSALPKYIRDQIPKEYQYWLDESEAKRIEIRDVLVEAMKKNEINVEIEKIFKLSQTDARFVLQHQEFKRKGKKLTKDGEYHLRLDIGKNFLMHWVSENDPIKIPEISSFYRRDDNKSYMTIKGDVPPNHPLNPTKEVRSYIKALDSGSCIVLVDEPNFKKVEFKGNNLKGLWTIIRNDGVWIISKSQKVSVPEKKSKIK